MGRSEVSSRQQEVSRSTTNKYQLRNAKPDDLEALVGYEIEIARISFPDDPVVDPDVHRKKLAKALGRDSEGMFVAEEADGGEVVGWLWVALNTNFLTGEQYATFRSLAAARSESRPDIADRLFAHGIEYARQMGVTEITGKVHVNNVAMRMVYKKFGFGAEHLTMKKKL
jgi:ribosomal protein S18 acetylase RimI-like enzyme